MLGTGIALCNRTLIPRIVIQFCSF